MATFVKLAVTTFRHDAPIPSADARDVWLNLDQVIWIGWTVAESTPADIARNGRIAFHPSLQLRTSDGDAVIVPLDVARNHDDALVRVATFLDELLPTPVPPSGTGPAATTIGGRGGTTKTGSPAPAGCVADREGQGE